MKYKPTFKYVIKQKQSCCNSCVFCFIDQNPQGLRKPLYFKDDDARLSFLYGNYITLTNLQEQDIQRIIREKTPINISVHTTNPALRSRLMGNPNAGETLETLYRFAAAKLKMNCQLVLCPGLNDGEELLRSLRDLAALKSVKSIACVPVGLTKFHKNGLRCFTKEEAAAVIQTVTSQNKADKVGQNRLVCADEFYLKAQLPIPEYEHYGDFPQYENGVGMWATMQQSASAVMPPSADCCKKLSIITGVAAFPLLRELFEPYSNITIHQIQNDFFGHTITVSGLLTGADIIAQLKGRDLGEMLLLPPNMFNNDNITLDDMTVTDIEKALGVTAKVIDKPENLWYYLQNKL